MYSLKPLLSLLLIVSALCSKAQFRTNYVNAFIGTEKSNVFTRWGSEGGTYPGAVAPSGYMQLTPETSVQEPHGYYYNDSAIYLFSCLQHKSGFPSGSAGQLYIMPVLDPRRFMLKKTKRKFSHQNEKASPGYYSVFFDDNHTRVEATASTRCAVVRFSFPEGVQPFIFIGGGGKIENESAHKVIGNKHNAVMIFDRDFNKVLANDSGNIYVFKPSPKGPTTILLRVSASPVGKKSSERNLFVETGTKNFEAIRQHTVSEWEKMLSVVDITDDDKDNVTVFYTALYHSLLIPWVVSDVDGNYLGRDRKIHRSSGTAQYAGFSPWDTFRSLHPLLSLLYPSKQQDIMYSLLDFYKQSGKLPVETMTGNHAIAVLVDAFLKGITADSADVYHAIKANVDTRPYSKKDMEVYIRNHYIPFSWQESVTRTTEYAYNDWCIGQYAKKIMQDESAFAYFDKRGDSYKNLLNNNSLFLLPREGDQFKMDPGNTGYKEGDKWVYTYFVPHQPVHAVNLLGGADFFAQRLDSALTNQAIVFDNETVFHVPYFFNYAGQYPLTQKWVHHILTRRYSNSPGGLPGNDDLGSMSSWFVWSAMGFYPFCPGNPVYTFGVPRFKSMLLQLANGKKLSIRKRGEGDFVHAVYLNGQQWTNVEIQHSLMLDGGSIEFEMAGKPGLNTFSYAPDASVQPEFALSDLLYSRDKVTPNEVITASFRLRNKGAEGSKVLRLIVDGKELLTKYAFVPAGGTLHDSIQFRLYAFGEHVVQLEENRSTIEVHDDGRADTVAVVQDLHLQPVLKTTEKQRLQYKVKNPGGRIHTFTIPVYVDKQLQLTDTVRLLPGEEKTQLSTLSPGQTGMRQIEVGNATSCYKVVEKPTEALLADLLFSRMEKNRIADGSGFQNHAFMQRAVGTTDSLPTLGDSTVVELKESESLNTMGESITMMAWIYTTGGDQKKVDILARGDHHVLQVNRNRLLKFFAGGWARGECDARLPANWKNKWHHVAGTCNGTVLKVYVDGILQSVTPLVNQGDLSGKGVWNIGSNEEFPFERNFNGYIRSVKIFAAALSDAEIKQQMEN